MAAAKRNEPSTVRFTTKELSKRTFADFERFFSQVHGCMCTLYSLGGHIPPPARTAKELAEQLGPPDRSKKRFPLQEWTRQQESKAMRELVWQGQAHGIVVYADGEPVGWCQFGRVEDPPVDDADDPAAWWRINCFTTRMDYRRQGVATRALAAAVSAIRKRGGGWIEASPMTFPHNDPMLRKLRKTFGWRSPELADYIRMNWPSREIPGVGRVNACPVSNRTMGHVGTMSMFEKLGFTVVGLDEKRSDQRYQWHRLLMRLKV